MASLAAVRARSHRRPRHRHPGERHETVAWVCCHDSAFGVFEQELAGLVKDPVINPLVNLFAQKVLLTLVMNNAAAATKAHNPAPMPQNIALPLPVPLLLFLL